MLRRKALRMLEEDKDKQIDIKASYVTRFFVK